MSKTTVFGGTILPPGEVTWQLHCIVKVSEVSKRILMKRRIAILLGLAAMLSLASFAQSQDVTLAEARAIAKEAAIYGFPVIDSYRIN